VVKGSGRGGLGLWGHRTTFVLAMAAAAVGFGNFWRFSALAGGHGGGAFVLTYLASLFLVAVPVMIAEVVIGLHGRGSPVNSLRWTSDRSLLSRGWVLLGVLACLTGLLVLSYCGVVGGWSLAYAFFMESGTFASASLSLVGGEFGAFIEEPTRQTFWQSLFLLLTGGVVALGVRRGLAIMVWLAVPSLIFLLLLLVRFALDQGDLDATRDFLFTVKLVDFGPDTVLLALGHALFTLGIGVGAGISYGAYAPRLIPVGRSVLAVAVFDTLIAVIAGLAVFPIVFANNMEPSMGPGLLFVSVPYAFGNILQGDVFGALFFVAVALAALGTAVALLEPAVGALIQNAGLRRPYAVLVTLTPVWLLGQLVIRGLAPGAKPEWFGQRNPLDVLELLTAGILLPLVSLLTAVYVGWRLRPEILRPQLSRESPLSFTLWRLLLRYVVPPAIGLVMWWQLAEGAG